MTSICKNCGKKFEAATKRVTCSRPCAVSLSWKNPEVAARKRASISKSKQTPEAMALLAEHNKRRWSKPEEHEKLSEQNRREWRHPRKRAKRAAGIRRSHQRPEMRAHYSRIRTEQWASDIEYRTKTVEGIRRSKGSPEYRALFSILLAERWNDPVMRAKYTAGIQRVNRSPEVRAKKREQMLTRWREDDGFRAMMAAASELYWSKPETREHHAKMMNALWSDPVWRMATLDKMNKRGATAGRIKECTTAASDLMGEVDSVIPRALPEFMRADIASDIMLALLEGDIHIDELKREAKAYLTAHRKMFPDKWGPMSIDAPIPGTDGLTIADTLSDDHPRF